MKRILFVAGLVALGSTTAAAQGRGASPMCPTSSDPLQSNYYTADACEKAIDLFNYMAPQLGTALAGGNATLGQGGTLGGIGHFAVGVRGNALFGSLPKVNESDVEPATGSAQADAYKTDTRPIPMPVVDVGVGVFKGLPLGVTHVGGIDLLANVSYIPAFNASNVSIEVPNGSVKLGYGARLGLLQESLVSPGVSFTVMRRELPTVNLAATVDGTLGSADLAVSDLSIKATSWRVTASKSLLVFGLALGAGQDKYESSATAQGTVNRTAVQYQSQQVALSQTVTRMNYFGSLSLNMMMAKLVGEVGMVQGGTIPTFNTFDKKADASRVYATVGLRIGL